MLSIFSCACLPSICLLWKNVCSGLLPIFWLGCLFFWYWVVWAAYIFWLWTPCQSYHLQIFSPHKSIFWVRCGEQKTVVDICNPRCVAVLLTLMLAWGAAGPADASLFPGTPASMSLRPRPQWRVLASAWHPYHEVNATETNTGFNPSLCAPACSWSLPPYLHLSFLLNCLPCELQAPASDVKMTDSLSETT